MKVVFYSTNSNEFDGNVMHYRTFPSCREQFEKLASSFPEHRFAVVTQLPGMFLLDVCGSSVQEKADGVEYIITQKQNAEDIASDILSLNPDVAVACTFWTAPFDWLGIKDALVADILRDHGIHTLCNSSSFEADCFDKQRTHLLLERLGIRTAKSVYVHHEQFWAERNHRDVRVNCYKEYIFSRLRSLRYPVVIKDTVGLSSYGMEVAKTFAQAKAFLLSKKNGSDRIVEEYISGFQFGAEVYGSAGNYAVCGPFLFSVNQYGITSPKQSVKAGPVDNARFEPEKLRSLLLRVSNACGVCGVAQFDLVFDPAEREWYVLEINPRLSGMSNAAACAYGASPLSLLLSPPHKCPPKMVMAFKFPLLSDEVLQKLYEVPSVLHVSQTENEAARQRRECGFCEVIFGGRNSPCELRSDLEKLASSFPEVIEPVFYKNAVEMIDVL